MCSFPEIAAHLRPGFSDSSPSFATSVTSRLRLEKAD